VVQVFYIVIYRSVLTLIGGGCDFLCSYCSEMVHGRFNPRPYEAFKALESWINGNRNADTMWCDWNIPLRIGVLSEPFPFSDFETRRMYKCLYTLAETGYPYVLTTKSTLVMHDEYLSLISQTNGIIQISMVTKQFALKYESNAPTFRDRFAMLYRLSKNVKRLVVRVQPFVVEYLDELLLMIPRYKASGVYALLVGGISLRRPSGSISYHIGDGYVQSDNAFHQSLVMIRQCCHDNDLVFLTCESNAMDLSDSLTCCGCEGLEGFKVNQCNLSYDFEKYITSSMSMTGSAQCFRSGTRDSRFKERTYLDVLRQFNADGNAGLVK